MVPWSTLCVPCSTLYCVAGALGALERSSEARAHARSGGRGAAAGARPAAGPGAGGGCSPVADRRRPAHMHPRCMDPRCNMRAMAPRAARRPAPVRAAPARGPPAPVGRAHYCNDHNTLELVSLFNHAFL